MNTRNQEWTKNHCCPNCGGNVDYRETTNAGKMWFCMKCPFCTSFEEQLKRREEEKKEVNPNNKSNKKPPMTEEARRVLSNILVI